MTALPNVPWESILREAISRCQVDMIEICTISAFRLSLFLRAGLELLGKLFVVEKCPWIVELMIPGPLKVSHRLDDALELAVSHQR
jgi:uncharacterized membrane protein